MDFQTVEKVLTQISVIMGALLALDNIADGVFKALGYKEGDTVCGQIAELLNRAKNKLPQPPTQEKTI